MECTIECSDPECHRLEKTAGEARLETGKEILALGTPPQNETRASLVGLRDFWAILSLAIWLLATANPSTAQTLPSRKSTGLDAPRSMVWIGNSFFYYNNSMHGHFFQLLKAGDQNYAFRQSSVTISGSGFGWHDVEALFRPNAIGSYSFVGDNEVRFNKIDRLFDLALMMDCSQCPIHPQLGSVFVEYAKKYSDIARKHGAQPVFFMSWAYADKPEMTGQLAESYVRAANDNDAMVVPTGLAFKRSIATRPDINLYAPDKRHPNLAGTYLGAATVYAAIMKRSPVGLSYTAGLPADVAAHLQRVAQETVADFLK